jgi:phosphohistidine phosphatase
MKNLILVRHAKSSWKDSSLDDHDRPLNKRGERDAPYMAKLLKEKKVEPDLMVTSTALRAFTTAREFARRLDYKKAKIERSDELYLAEVNEMLNYVRQLPDKHNIVMLFGHNPAITWFANQLSGGVIENIPTCGVCSITFNIETWKDVSEGSGKIDFFEYPKMYFKDSED